MKVEANYRPYIYSNQYNLPSPGTLRALVLNHRTFGADLAWIQGVLYTGDAFVARRQADEATDFARAVVTLDPYFYRAYSWQSGARIMISGRPTPEDVEQINDLIEYGMGYYPDDWQLPFEAAANYIGYFSDVDADVRAAQLRRAIDFAETAASRPDAPQTLSMLPLSLRRRLAKLESESPEQERTLDEDERKMLVRLYLNSSTPPSTRKYIENRFERTGQEALLLREIKAHETTFRRIRESSKLGYLPENIFMIISTSMYRQSTGSQFDGE